MLLLHLVASSLPSFPVWDTLLVTRCVGAVMMVVLQSANICDKVLQRIYKYGGQPFARDYLAKHHGPEFDNAFGKGTGKAVMHATAGRYASSSSKVI